MKYAPSAVGEVVSLCVNGIVQNTLAFEFIGPVGDKHSSYIRKLSGHDTDYIRTSELERGHNVFNWRSWTGLSTGELAEIEKTLDVPIPPGCLLENISISGIPGFSELAPTTRLVFPPRNETQLILAVWEQNGPCRTVGDRLAAHHNNPDLMTKFVQAAQGKRGVMGFVLSVGRAEVGDEVLVYPPV